MPLKTFFLTELHETYEKMPYHETVSLKRKQRSNNSRKRKRYLGYHRRNPTAKKEEQFEQLQIFASGNSLRRNREIGATEHLTDGQPNY
jgi:hypothetical protein